MERSILQWFADSPIGPKIMSIPWMFPTLESLHFLGVCLLFGSLLVVDLRLLGVVKGVRMASTFTFLLVTIGSFALVALTGLGFFFTNPFNYWHNPVFKIKMVLVLLGGLNAAAFTLLEHRKLAALGPDASGGRLTQVAAGLSLGMWACVLFAGRSLPLFDTGQG